MGRCSKHDNRPAIGSTEVKNKIIGTDIAEHTVSA
jgi:hypothetical protein